MEKASSSKRPRYDAAFRAEALRLASESRSKLSVADYFDYYNHKRRHSSIGYLKPYLFHQQQLVNIT